MTPNPNFWLPLTLAITLFAGCGDDPEPTLQTFENDGEVCLNRSGFQDDAPVEADTPIELRVELPVCLSSSCSAQAQASCELSVDATTNTITLTSEGSYLDTSAVEGSCTADCGLLHAECEIPALPEGQYTLTHGDTVYTFDVPSEPTGCLEPSSN